MLRTRRVAPASPALRPGVDVARNLPGVPASQWVNYTGSTPFDPTAFGITWQVCTWTEDPAWTPPSDKARVSSTRDASGNSLTPTQGTATYQPAYQAHDSHLGGRPSIRGGYDTLLLTPTFSSALSQPVSYVFIGYMHTPYWETAGTAAVALDHGTTPGAATLYSVCSATHAGKIGFQTGTLIEGARDLRAGVWVAKGGASGFVSRNGTTTVSGSTGTNTLGRLGIGGLPNVGSFPRYGNWGGWGMVGVYSGDITAHANWPAFLAAAQAHYGLTTAGSLIAVDGDSRETNYPHGASPSPSPAQAWPALLSNTTSTPVTICNFGVPAQTQAQMNADAVAQIDSLYSATYAKNIAITAGGINDLPSSSAATIESAIQTWCTTRRAAGFQVIVATIPPATSVSGANETKRAAINAWVVANWASWADGLCDLAADSRMQTPADTTYYLADGVHYTAAGHAVVAELMRTQLATLGVYLNT